MAMEALALYWFIPFCGNTKFQPNSDLMQMNVVLSPFKSEMFFCNNNPGHVNGQAEQLGWPRITTTHSETGFNHQFF